MIIYTIERKESEIDEYNASGLSSCSRSAGYIWVGVENTAV